MERVFDAPRELVWKALTERERVPRWWGPRHLRNGGGDGRATGWHLAVDQPFIRW